MLRWRVTNDAQPRSKNGQPPHSTAGVARISCTQTARCGGDQRIERRFGEMLGHGHGEQWHRERKADPEAPGHVAQFGIFGSAVGVIGSSAMPQIGQGPGSSRTISGCIGQVQRTLPACACGGG